MFTLQLSKPTSDLKIQSQSLDDNISKLSLAIRSCMAVYVESRASRQHFGSLFLTYCLPESINTYFLSGLQDSSVNVSGGNLFLKDDRVCGFNPSFRVRGSDSGILNALYDDFFSSIDADRASRKRRNLFNAVIACVIGASRCPTPKAVLYSRNSSFNYAAKSVARITDFLASKNLIVNVVGCQWKSKCEPYPKSKPKENKGKVGNAGSWMIATETLKIICKSLKIKDDIATGNNKDIIRVKNDQGKHILVSNLDQAVLRAVSAPVNAHNTCWMGHIATLYQRPFSPYVYRSFNRNFDLGGRFYSGYQQIPKKDRQEIKLDGKSTIELDYKYHHINLMYADKGKQLCSDPYYIYNIDRDVSKSLILSLFNAEKVGYWKRKVTVSGNPKNKKRMAVYRGYLAEHERKVAAGIPSSPPRKPVFIKQWVDGIPDGMTGVYLFNIIKKKHSVIADFFGSKDLGVKLQNKDSIIMGEILMELAALNILALPVHDSVICAINVKHIVKDVMLSAYKRVTGFNAVVE